jgi:predicted metal-dependent HD superfamily phosphohydrolase
MENRIIVERIDNVLVKVINPELELFNGIKLEIIQLYSEEHRKYHNLSHLSDLFTLKDSFIQLCTNNLVIDLSIIYHDIIYDPKSSLNEENSANLFKERLSSFLEPNVLDKIYEYIIQTKTHDVSHSEDDDLKFFIDLDMSVLGRSLIDYIVYANNIRQEYIHVEDSVYCEKRSLFLKTSLENVEFIFATNKFRSLYELQARKNIEWECSQLDLGNIPLHI